MPQGLEKHCCQSLAAADQAVQWSAMVAVYCIVLGQQLMHAASACASCFKCSMQ
jgi:hypothetical protein